MVVTFNDHLIGRHQRGVERFFGRDMNNPRRAEPHLKSLLAKPNDYDAKHNRADTHLVSGRATTQKSTDLTLVDGSSSLCDGIRGLRVSTPE